MLKSDDKVKNEFVWMCGVVQLQMQSTDIMVRSQANRTAHKMINVDEDVLQYVINVAYSKQKSGFY